MSDAKVTTRAYTIKLAGKSETISEEPKTEAWRDLLWKTHVAVNRGAWAWGDWLLTLRGGLPATLADDHPERRVLLALSWLAVESPTSLVPRQHVVAQDDILARFRRILDQLNVSHQDEWVGACEPALMARIRDDAVWVDRSATFRNLQVECEGLTREWAAGTLFDLLGGEEAYFAMPDDEEATTAEAKDFVQKAGGWFSRNWGAGEKSDATAIESRLQAIAEVSANQVVGRTGSECLLVFLRLLGSIGADEVKSTERLKHLKHLIGWKGRSSKGAVALEKISTAPSVTTEQWEQTQKKLLEEAVAQGAKAGQSGSKTLWMQTWRQQMESKIGVPYRSGRDLIWEHGVTLDHALRRVSSAHSWIKRAEVERRRFQEDATKQVSQSATEWLNSFREERAGNSGALGEYIIHKRAIDGWDKVVRAWSDLPDDATESDRIQAARDVQSNLDDNEKFGDIQLFQALAVDGAKCVWRTEGGEPSAQILKDYSAATVAEHNQRRFKVPAYRHPDPLRNPIYVDFGNSRWGISYSALAAVQRRQSLSQKIETAKTDATREKLRKELAIEPDLRGVTLDLWTGEAVEPIELRWQGKRLWKDLDLNHFDIPSDKTVTRADRLGRAVAGRATGSVSIAEVFGQKDWNGRLQVPRKQLNRLADLLYGKQKEPDYSRLDSLTANPSAFKAWQRLNWFLTTSAKLQPTGPWLEFVENGLPAGIEFKQGRSGSYVHYDVNKDRKSRARLQLSRIPNLRVLSFDLGHRYAAACAVWETLSSPQIQEECQKVGRLPPTAEQQYLHLRQPAVKIQKSGKRKGQPVVQTVVYRRIGPDLLPDGTPHAAPWARLDRQFLIKLQGEDRPVRRATKAEFESFNELKRGAGLSAANGEPTAIPRIDAIQAESVRIAQLGLRRLGDIARVAYILTAEEKPVAGGNTIKLTREQRVEYVLDALLLWQGLAKSRNYKDEWVNEQWQRWIVSEFDGPPPLSIANEVSRSEEKKRVELSRLSLKDVAGKLADRDNNDLHQLWREEWKRRSDEWQRQLRVLRRLILPRIGKCALGSDAGFSEWKRKAKELHHVGGLSVRRLKTIRDLYQILKAFRMRPEPDDLRKNAPNVGDVSFANFGRRILDQLERLRQQRIKQLASRIVEAALGVGSENRIHRDGKKRPLQGIAEARFAPCHVVVAENLERYRPEETRLRRENRQLMDWAARNSRKFIVEGCQLYGLHFVEVSPAYTSRQDSRTGAPGIRCEDVARSTMTAAAQQLQGSPSQLATDMGRGVGWWVSEIRRALATASAERSPRERVIATAIEQLRNLPSSITSIRVPRRGGELFVSSDKDSPAASGLQADLNAAANIGLKALLDPDGMAAWWFVLVNSATGQPDPEKIKGCTILTTDQVLLPQATSEPDVNGNKTGVRKRAKRSKKEKVAVYAWNSLAENTSGWRSTQDYWKSVEDTVAEELRRKLLEPETPW